MNLYKKLKGNKLSACNLIYKTRKSHYYNEDRFFIGKDYVLVLDGATGLLPSKLYPTSGANFASYIKSHLPKNYILLDEKLENISKEFYLKYFNGVDDMAILPSAGMVIANLNQDKVNLAYIGDCEIAVEYKDDSFQLFMQKELSQLDKKAINLMEEYSKNHNVSLFQARKDKNDILIQNRRLANKENGYNVYSCSSLGKFNFSKTSLDISNIKAIYLYTDGFASLWDTFKIYPSYVQCLKTIINQESLDLLFNKIEQIAYQDTKLNKYPRFKVIDDITFVKINLK